MTVTRTRTRTLPATGRVVPADPPFRIAGYRQWQARDGVGFTVRLTMNGTEWGTVQDDGHGGGSWFQSSRPGAHTEFEAYVAAVAALDPEAYAFMSHESVCNDLADEADLHQRLTRAARRTEVTLARRADDPKWGWQPWRTADPGDISDALDEQGALSDTYKYLTLPHELDPGFRAYLRGEGFLVWDRGEWRTP